MRKQINDDHVNAYSESNDIEMFFFAQTETFNLLHRQLQ